MPRLAVVGGGLAGLVTLKSALEEGVEAVLFEADEDLGGNWRLRADGPSVARDTELTSSRDVTAFSDFPLPGEGPHFLHHQAFLAYLEAYADHFGLRPHLRFGQPVLEARPDPDGWVVRTPAGEQGFTHLAVCTGLSRVPAMPDIAGAFSGPVAHTSTVLDAAPYAGQRVLVVGGGESATDILAELAEVCPEVHLSLRRGPLVFPKAFRAGGLPADHLHSRSTYMLPRVVYERVEELFGGLMDVRLGLLPGGAGALRRRLRRASGGRYHQQVLLKSDTILDTLRRPSVHLRGRLVRFEGSQAVFADGTCCEVDAVLYGTGFRIDFPFLPLSSAGWDWTRLYKTIVHPDLPRCGFIGFGRPDIGAIPPVTELQARWFAGVVSGRLRVPSGASLLDAIARDAARTRALKPLVVERQTSVVEFLPYQLELAALIGCQPRLGRLLGQPRLLWSVLFGTVLASHYRLHGPHPWSGAAQVLRDRGFHWAHLRHPADLVAALSVQLWHLLALLWLPLALVWPRSVRVRWRVKDRSRPLPALAPLRLFDRIQVRCLWALGQVGLGGVVKRGLVRRHVTARPGRLHRYAVQPGDVFVCTWSKSGSNWMLQLALQTAWRGGVDFDHIHQLVPWPDAPGPILASLERPVRSRDGLQIVKTHLRQDQVPWSSEGRYVVVLRDPRDAVVSGYHFTRGVLDAMFAGPLTPEQWLDAFLHSEFLMGSWAAHVAGWWAVRDAPNVLLVTFREMKADLPGVAARLAEFLGVGLDVEEAEAVLERSSFPWMKANDARFSPINPVLRQPSPPMIREGRVGAAGELYDDEQLAAIRAHCLAELEGLGCDLPFEAFFGGAG